MCSWALRSLLIEDGERLILIDTGMGEKQSDKFFSYYYLHGDDSLDKNLKKLGFSRDDITDVFLSHLHFDHCGGAVEWNDQKMDIDQLSKMPPIGAPRIIGNGQLILTTVKKHLS